MTKSEQMDLIWEKSEAEKRGLRETHDEKMKQLRGKFSDLHEELHGSPVNGLTAMRILMRKKGIVAVLRSSEDAETEFNSKLQSLDESRDCELERVRMSTTPPC